MWYYTILSRLNTNLNEKLNEFEWCIAWMYRFDFFVGIALQMVESAMENGVSVVTLANFRQLIKANRVLLIMCYVPWYCIQMLQRFLKIEFYTRILSQLLRIFLQIFFCFKKFFPCVFHKFFFVSKNSFHVFFTNFFLVSKHSFHVFFHNFFLFQKILSMCFLHFFFVSKNSFHVFFTNFFVS